MVLGHRQAQDPLASLETLARPPDLLDRSQPGPRRIRASIPWFRPVIGEEEIEAVRVVPRSGWLTTGPKAHEFEQNVAAFIGPLSALAPVDQLAGAQGRQVQEKRKIGTKGDFEVRASREADPQGRKTEREPSRGKHQSKRSDRTAFCDAGAEHRYASALNHPGRNITPGATSRSQSWGTIRGLARRLISLASFVPEKDIAIEFVGIREGEKLHEELFDDNEMLETTDVPGIRLARSQVQNLRRMRELRDGILSVGSNGDPQAVVAMFREFLSEGLQGEFAGVAATARDAEQAAQGGL